MRAAAKDRDPQRRQEWSKRYYQENRETYNQRSRIWRDANRERYNEGSRRRASENREAEIERVRAWQIANPEKCAAWASRRRARLLAASVAPMDLAPLMAALRTLPCAYCGSTERIEIDHVVPLTRGGSHTPDNLVPACKRCNCSKGNRLLSEWQRPVLRREGVRSRKGVR